jgi:hypothetical protein
MQVSLKPASNEPEKFIMEGFSAIALNSPLFAFFKRISYL